MKKLIISAMLLAASLAGSAQLVEVTSMQHVQLPEGLSVNVATLSPDGSFVVVSDNTGNALTKIDLATGEVSTVTNNGSGYDVRISDDGRNVVFRQTTTGKNNLRYTALKNVSIADGKETELVAPSRRLNSGVALTDNTVAAIEGGKVRTRRVGAVKETAPAMVSINYGHLEYTKDGKTVTLDPQGRGSYLWPTLSPDGTQVAYYLAGRGCFVCNVDGSNARALGMLRAAKWLNNDVLVGMNDTDNGETTTASSIIATDLNGTRQTLTEDSHIAMYPSPSADGKHIAFSTVDGNLFIINLK